MLIIAVNFPNVFHAVGLAYGAHPHYRYFRSEGYGGQARLYALVPYCLSALFAYRRACAELQFLQPHLPSVTEYGQSFPFYQNKYTYACGREDLKPSYTYNAELGYTLKNNFNVSAYYSYSDDVFFQVVDLDAETNVTSFLWENFMQTHAFGLNNSYTFRTKWLQAYAQHGVSYRRTTSSAATTSPEEKGWAYNASLRNTFFFNEKKTLLATLSGSYSSRQYQGIYLMSPTYSVSAGMLYRLLNNKLSLSLNVNNLFVSHSKLETMSNGLKIIADNQFAFASFRIGVSYTFGGDIRSKGQRNSNEDIQRRL